MAQWVTVLALQRLGSQFKSLAHMYKARCGCYPSTAQQRQADTKGH